MGIQHRRLPPARDSRETGKLAHRVKCCRMWAVTASTAGYLICQEPTSCRRAGAGFIARSRHAAMLTRRPRASILIQPPLQGLGAPQVARAAPRGARGSATRRRHRHGAGDSRSPPRSFAHSCFFFGLATEAESLKRKVSRLLGSGGSDPNGCPAFTSRTPVTCIVKRCSSATEDKASVQSRKARSAKHPHVLPREGMCLFLEACWRLLDRVWRLASFVGERAFICAPAIAGCDRSCQCGIGDDSFTRYCMVCLCLCLCTCHIKTVELKLAVALRSNACSIAAGVFVWGIGRASPSAL